MKDEQEKICVCCQQTMETEMEAPARVVTGRVCLDCRDRFFAAVRPVPLTEFLNRFTMPVLVMDDHVRVVGVNDSARALLGKRLDDCIGHLGGDVMECAYARLPGGCGNTEHCKGCTIRLAVAATHATGESRLKIPAYQDVSKSNVVREFRYLISTEKVGEFVLLRIDEVRQS